MKLIANLLLSICALLINFTNAQIPSYVPKDSLVGWWSFNGNANDQSTKGNNFQLNGNATYTTDRFGNSNAAVTLDGDNDYISSVNNIYKSSNNHTLSLWFNFTSFSSSGASSSDRCFFNTAPSSNHAIEAWTFNSSQTSGGNNSACYLGNGSSWYSAPTFQSTLNVSTSTWYNWVITKNQFEWIVYLNGKLVKKFNLNYTPSSSVVGLMFGAMCGGPSAPEWDVNGLFDDIGLWNRALDSNEVKGLYLSCNSTYVKSQKDYNTFLGSNFKLSCFSDSFKLVPTRSFVKYLWNNGFTDSFIQAKSSGNYSLIGKDKYGCNFFDTVNLYISNSRIYKSKDTFCSADSIKLTFDEKLINTTSPTYLWNNTINSKDFTIKGQGKFVTKLTIKTPNGNCYDSTISYLSNPIYKFTADTFLNKDCSRNGLKMKVSNTNWNSLVWNDGTNDTLKLIDKTGTYSVTFKDKYSCTYFDDFYYENPGKPVLQNMLTNQIHCFGLNDGEIKVRTIGGFHPIQYSWNSTISSDTNKSNLTKGNYKIVSIDKFQCKDSISVEIIEPKQLTIQLISKNSPSCSNKTDGNAEIEIVGGRLPYSILWNDNKSQNSKTATDLNAGKYQVIVKDSSHCSDSIRVTIDTAVNHPPQVLSNPSNQGLKQGDALFVIKTTNNVKSIQWQTNFGTGWSDLSNAGQYSGVNSDSLVITQVSSSNNNQIFRCIISGDCGKDTSVEAKLSVWEVNTNSINKQAFILSPNPVKDILSIQGVQNKVNFQITNSIGQPVIQGTSDGHLDVSKLKSGVYLFKTEIGTHRFIKE